jgi:hypothetical protein
MRDVSFLALLPRLRTCWMGITTACLTAVLAVALVAAACNGGTGPESCNGTCLVVSNQSELSVIHVYVRPCTDAVWGEDRLSGGVIPSNDEREWSINPGCWDVLMQAIWAAHQCSNLENDVEITSDERHLSVFKGCG